MIPDAANGPPTARHQEKSEGHLGRLGDGLFCRGLLRLLWDLLVVHVVCDVWSGRIRARSAGEVDPSIRGACRWADR